METQKIYTVKDVAKVLILSESRVRQLIREGIIKGEKATPGGRSGKSFPKKSVWIVRREDLLGYLNQCHSVNAANKLQMLRLDLLKQCEELGDICDRLFAMSASNDPYPEVHAVLALLHDANIIMDTLHDTVVESGYGIADTKAYLIEDNSDPNQKSSDIFIDGADFNL